MTLREAHAMALAFAFGVLIATPLHQTGWRHLLLGAMEIFVFISFVVLVTQAIFHKPRQDHP